MAINWEGWSKAERWTHLQAACLTLGQDPDGVPETDIHALQSAARVALSKRYAGDTPSPLPGTEWYGPSRLDAETAKTLPDHLLKLSERCNELFSAFPLSESPRAAAVMKWAGQQQEIAPEFIRMAGERLYLPARSLKALSAEIAKRDGTGDEGRRIALYRLTDAMRRAGMTVSVHSVEDNEEGACHFVLEEDAETCLLKHGMTWPFPPSETGEPASIFVLGRPAWLLAEGIRRAAALSAARGKPWDAFSLTSDLQRDARAGRLDVLCPSGSGRQVKSGPRTYETDRMHSEGFTAWFEGTKRRIEMPPDDWEAGGPPPEKRSGSSVQLEHEFSTKFEASDALARDQRTVSRDLPSGLPTSEVALAFGGLHFEILEWGKRLKDRPDWLRKDGIKLTDGTTGNSHREATWNPVVVANALLAHRHWKLSYEEKRRHLDRVFAKAELMSWRTEWEASKPDSSLTGVDDR